MTNELLKIPVLGLHDKHHAEHEHKHHHDEPEEEPNILAMEKWLLEEQLERLDGNDDIKELREILKDPFGKVIDSTAKRYEPLSSINYSSLKEPKYHSLKDNSEPRITQLAITNIRNNFSNSLLKILSEKNPNEAAIKLIDHEIEKLQKIINNHTVPDTKTRATHELERFESLRTHFVNKIPSESLNFIKDLSTKINAVVSAVQDKFDPESHGLLRRAFEAIFAFFVELSGFTSIFKVNEKGIKCATTVKSLCEQLLDNYHTLSSKEKSSLFAKITIAIRSFKKYNSMVISSIYGNGEEFAMSELLMPYIEITGDISRSALTDFNAVEDKTDLFTELTYDFGLLTTYKDINKMEKYDKDLMIKVVKNLIQNHSALPEEYRNDIHNIALMIIDNVRSDNLEQLMSFNYPLNDAEDKNIMLKIANEIKNGAIEESIAGLATKQDDLIYESMAQDLQKMLGESSNTGDVYAYQLAFKDGANDLVNTYLEKLSMLAKFDEEAFNVGKEALDKSFSATLDKLENQLNMAMPSGIDIDFLKKQLEPYTKAYDAAIEIAGKKGLGLAQKDFALKFPYKPSDVIAKAEKYMANSKAIEDSIGKIKNDILKIMNNTNIVNRADDNQEKVDKMYKKFRKHLKLSEQNKHELEKDKIEFNKRTIEVERERAEKQQENMLNLVKAMPQPHYGGGRGGY